MTNNNTPDPNEPIELSDAMFTQVVQESLATLFKRMEDTINTAAPGDDELLDEDNPIHAQAIQLVDAIQQEWIIDEDLRDELSLLQDHTD